MDSIHLTWIDLGEERLRRGGREAMKINEGVGWGEVMNDGRVMKITKGKMD